MRGGISFPPWPRFRRPPYNPGRPDFPWSGLKPWLSSVSLPIVGEVQALVRIRPVFRGLPTASRPGQHRCDAGFIKPATALTRTPPSVQVPSPPAGVTAIGRDVYRLLRGHYSSVIATNSYDAWAPITTVGRLHMPGSSSATAAFPTGKWVGIP